MTRTYENDKLQLTESQNTSPPDTMRHDATPEQYINKARRGATRTKHPPNTARVQPAQEAVKTGRRPEAQRAWVGALPFPGLAPSAVGRSVPPGSGPVGTSSWVIGAPRDGFQVALKLKVAAVKSNSAAAWINR